VEPFLCAPAFIIIGLRIFCEDKQQFNTWHTVCRADACGIVQIVDIDSKNNPADILTKRSSSREWYELFRPIIFWS
jgi:hypothetical protein